MSRTWSRHRGVKRGTDGLQEGFTEAVSPALSPDGLHSEEFVEPTRQKFFPTGPC